MINHRMNKQLTTTKHQQYQALPLQDYMRCMKFNQNSIKL